MKTLNIAALVILLSACGDPEPLLKKAPATDIEQLSSTIVTLAKVNDEVDFDGTIEAVNQVIVSAQTAGRVIELPFDVGDIVEKGQVIVRITDSEQQAEIKIAKAQLFEAKARFSEAEQQLNRIKNVFKKGVVSKSEFDQVKAAQMSASARVDSANALVNDAEQRLEYTLVIAPYKGILVRRLVNIGATVSPGTPLIEGVSLENLRVKVDVPQQYISALRQHRLARVTLDKGISIDVTDLRIAPSADPTTQNFRILLALPKTEPTLFPGTLVKVALAIGSSEHILVPKRAIAKRGEVTAVYVFGAEKQLEFRYIRLGKTLSDGQVVSLSGLVDGEQIALDPVTAAGVYKTQHFIDQQ